MHPHGVKYNPEYDGAYMGEFTRAGGFIAPGESFTYQWECTPDSVGVWPYHDHGPNHTLNTFRGLFGAIIVRPRGREVAGPRLHPVRAPAPAAVTRPGAQLPLLQRPRLRRQHADAARARRRGRRDQRVRHGLQLPHVPHPRPPLEGSGGGLHRQPGVRDRTSASRPASSRTTRVAGSTTATSSRIRTRGWRAGTSSTRRRGGRSFAFRCASLVVLVVALLAPAAASAQTYPEPKQPGRSSPKPKGPHKTYTVCKKKSCDFKHDPEGRRQGQRRRHGPRPRRRLPRGRQGQRVQEALPEADRQPGATREGAAARPRATCRTASSSTTPTRSPSTASWPAATRPTASSSRTSTATR